MFFFYIPRYIGVLIKEYLGNCRKINAIYTKWDGIERLKPLKLVSGYGMCAMHFVHCACCFLFYSPFLVCRFTMIDLVGFINFTSYCETKGKKSPVQRTPSATPSSGTTTTPLQYDGKNKNLDSDLWDDDYVCPGLFSWLAHGPLSLDPCGFVDPTEIRDPKKSKREADAAASKRAEGSNQSVDSAQGNNVPVGGTMHDMAKMGIAVTHLKEKGRATSVLGLQGFNSSLTQQMESILGALGRSTEGTALHSMLSARLATIFGSLDRAETNLQQQLQVSTALPETTRAFIAVGDRHSTAPTVAASSEVTLLTPPVEVVATPDEDEMHNHDDDDGLNRDPFADENNFEMIRPRTDSGGLNVGGEEESDSDEQSDTGLGNSAFGAPLTTQPITAPDAAATTNLVDMCEAAAAVAITPPVPNIRTAEQAGLSTVTPPSNKKMSLPKKALPKQLPPPNTRASKTSTATASK